MEPLPAALETVLLYLAYLADSKSYVTIINYLSAVWSFHRVNGVPHIDTSSFPIKMTLKGIHRTNRDSKNQAAVLTVNDLHHIFTCLDLLQSEHVAFWLDGIFCFRGLLRKSKVVERDLALLVSDAMVQLWGLLIKVRRTKTITCRERVLEIPFNVLPSFIFCVCRFFKILR